MAAPIFAVDEHLGTLLFCPGHRPSGQDDQLLRLVAQAVALLLQQAL